MSVVVEPLDARFGAVLCDVDTKNPLTVQDFRIVEQALMQHLLVVIADPDVVHPVVRVHPRTGRRSLFVNPGYTMCINGVPSDESEAILGALFEHSQRDEFCYRHHWTVGQLVGIDNRATLHCVMADYREPMRKLRMIVGCTERDTAGAGNLLS